MASNFTNPGSAHQRIQVHKYTHIHLVHRHIRLHFDTDYFYIHSYLKRKQIIQQMVMIYIQSDIPIISLAYILMSYYIPICFIMHFLEYSLIFPACSG